MNSEYKLRVEQFLGLNSIAVVGYSSTEDQPANLIFDKLRNNGYEVTPINPQPEKFKDLVVFPDLRSLPDLPDGVVICTPPEATLSILRQCVELGIRHAWIHHSIDQGSWTREAEEYAELHGMNLIPSGCPLMFLQPDFGHACIKFFLNIGGVLKAGSKAKKEMA